MGTSTPPEPVELTELPSARQDLWQLRGHVQLALEMAKLNSKKIESLKQELDEVKAAIQRLEQGVPS